MTTAIAIAPPATSTKSHLVVFMTATRPADIPDSGNSVACLLPFGSVTFAERTMESCALAGVRHMHLVASDHPEALRAHLGDGSAWGIELKWHLVKDARTPYEVLRSFAFADDDLVVVGHAHQWICERVVRLLHQAPSIAMHVGQAVFWSGWYSDKASRLGEIDSHDNYASLAKLISSRSVPCILARSGEFAKAGSAAELLEVQNLILAVGMADPVPASWRRMPWGAMSPDAVVNIEAQMQGPVLVGPGCVVERAAEVGPNVVLTKDVYVSAGAQVRKAVVLPNTYVGGRVTLDRAVAQGNVVQNLKWGVRTVLADQDSMLTPLFRTLAQRTPLSSRLVASTLTVLLLPLLVVSVALQWALRRPVLWRTTEVVKGRCLQSGKLLKVKIRQAHATDWLTRVPGFYGALLDVVQGRRRWFGLRSRSASEWYALGRDWQTLFSHSMLGIFHAPSWTDCSAISDNESEAAADAFMAVHATGLDRLSLIKRMLWT
jgi:hypothetical protein